MEIPLDVLFQGEFHVVPEIVESEFVIGAVSDIRPISPAALVVVQAVDNSVHRESQKAVNAAHPLGIPAGQVVVDRDDVHALASQGVEVGGHGGHQGFSFTGLHFGDFALVQHEAADELDVEGTHPQHPDRSFPGRGKGFGEQVLNGFIPVQPLFEFRSFGLQRRVGQFPVIGLQGRDPVHQRRQPFQFPVVFAAKYFFKKEIDHMPICQ
jgi:hypothetical protein